MPRELRFDAPENHLLDEGGELIRGGGTFEVSVKRAKELLADPNVPVSDSSDPEPTTQEPEATGEGQPTTNAEETS